MKINDIEWMLDFNQGLICCSHIVQLWKLAKQILRRKEPGKISSNRKVKAHQRFDELSQISQAASMIELSDFNFPSSLPIIESISCGDFCARCSSLWKVRRIQGNQKLGKLENWKFPLALDVCRMTRREKRRHELGAERQERNFQFEFSLTNGE